MGINDNKVIDYNSDEPKFYSSITDKYYYIRKDIKGRLNLFDAETGRQYPSYNKPNYKKTIAKQALNELNVEYAKDITVARAISILKQEICKRK